MYLDKVVRPVIQYQNDLPLLIFVSVAVREILDREVANLVQMAKIMVYNVELAKHFYAYIHFCS